MEDGLRMESQRFRAEPELSFRLLQGTLDCGLKHAGWLFIPFLQAPSTPARKAAPTGGVGANAVASG
jgi:hypothetical protein